ncbi:50S ribosomal protein L22 [bacterium]|nr:50S ribosomal protein L22 [bacterium]
MEVKAKLKRVKMSPKKIRLVADAVRGLGVLEALEKLPVIFKGATPVVEKLLKSAIANAKDRYNVEEKDLEIKSIFVNKGMDLKRWKPAAFGRAHPIRKHSSHIEIVVASKEGVRVAAKDKKKAEIETVDLTKTDQKGPKQNIDDKKNKGAQDSKKSFKETITGKAKNKSNVKKG